MSSPEGTAERRRSAAVSVSARAFAEDERCRFRPSSTAGLRVVIRLTERCDLRCPHCLAGVPGSAAGADLPLETWKEILADLPAIGAHKVLLTGGEPLLFAGLAELTAHVAGMDVTTDLNSNLWRLTPRLAAHLASAGLTEASVSLEGPAPVHDCLHGRPGAYGHLMAGLRMLREAGVQVDGSLCVSPANLPHVEATVAEAARLGLASFTISRMLPAGHGLRPSEPAVPERELRRLHARLDAARAGRYGISVRCVGLLGAPPAADCAQGGSLIGIRADGTLTPCVLSRDTVPGVPPPRQAGLAHALARLRCALEQVRCTRCYGGASQ